ncbi:hypothetical protein PMNALOAF_1870 [Methylobacterium adhaesivum]|uniref:Rhamnan synthesis F family protein n=1 Tax=Methylobacterium adhaesivum TaxID=333297 RepID=A0ABT8BEA3_9HYPH|nr:rhamnan synthesis F family protein [Methylobacterium adhaesivum]MDN3589605.1 rhamnan synthesis F family protein [Methylobacterium adhaesivum]GJD30622.1 hypothetical protein PMNALOAF_1870 [Methylobacterium adhaesivum]
MRRLSRTIVGLSKSRATRPSPKTIRLYDKILDRAYYLSTHPDVAAEGIDPLRHFSENGAREGRSPHPLFDPVWYASIHSEAADDPLGHFLSDRGGDPHPLFDARWYRDTYRDVVGSNRDAFIHYIEHGAREGRDPHPLFDTAWYVARHPEARRAPLVHYLSGRGTWPHPLFDDVWYREAHAKSVASGINPLAQYVAGGWREHNPNPFFHLYWYFDSVPELAGGASNPLIHYARTGEAAGLRPHPLFDPDWYREQVAGADLRGEPLASPLADFLHRGGPAGLSSHRLIDPAWYYDVNSDVAEENVPAARHYLVHGWIEGRNPHPLFDIHHYRRTNQDVAAAGLEPLTHYVANGYREGRSPHPLFDPRHYALHSPDVIEAGRDPLVHYLTYGAAEGRDPNLFFDSAWYTRQHESRLDNGTINPLLHYLSAGARESRDPSPLVDREFYLAHHQDVLHAGVDPLQHYVTGGHAEGRLPRPPDRWSEVCAVTDIPCEIRRDPPPLADRDVCFFVTYTPDGRVHDHTLAYLAALKAEGLTVVVIVATDGLSRPLPEALESLDGLLVRINHGWDFAAWAAAIATFPDVWKARSLILTNDSIYGPVDRADFAQVIERVRTSEADLVGLTDSYQARPHLMSYFIGLTRTGLAAPAIRRHWADVRSIRDKLEVIKAYEMTPLAHWKAEDVAVEVLFPTADDVPLAVNPTLVRWRELLARGFPFLKVQLLRDTLEQADPTGWETVLDGNPALRGAIERHLAVVAPKAMIAPKLVPAPGPEVDAGAQPEDEPEAATAPAMKPQPTLRPVPAPRRRFKRNTAARTFYGATQSMRPREATDLALEVPFAYGPDARGGPVAVVMHVFYPEMMPELLARIAHIPVRADLYVSTDTSEKQAAIAASAADYANGTVEVRVFPNIGRDIAPTIIGFQDVFARYDIFLHIHSKKSPHDPRFAPWRDYLLDNLLGSPEVVASVLRLLAEEDVGLVFSQHFGEVRPLLNWGYDFDLAKDLLARAGITLRKDYVLDFPSSSFFWARSAAVKPLLDIGLDWGDFPAEAGQIDGTLAHAIERSLLYFAESAGFRWTKVARVGTGTDETLVPVPTEADVAPGLVRVYRPLLGNPLRPYQQRHLFPEVTPVATRSDPSPRPRLNLVLPTLHPKHIFGGITTALRTFEGLAAALGDGFDRRIICGYVPIDLETMAGMPDYRLVSLGSPYDAFPRTIVDVYDIDGGELPIRAGDIFMPTAWWTASGSELFQAAQGRYHGRELPVLYLIQDHEPGFYGWSSNFSMSRATYAHPDKTIALINSEELANYMLRHYALTDASIVRYAANQKIRNALSVKKRERIILVYGRPSTPRNCFETLCAGLSLWQQAEPTVAAEWRIVSAGEDYDPARAGGVYNLEVCGKLTLEDYADVLSRASVGISLMVSPHPSYPPLEMAHAGLRTITNAYECKDLSARSPNLTSLDILTPDALADALSRIVREAEAEIGRVRPFCEIAPLPCPLPDYDPAALAERLRGLVEAPGKA